MRSFVAALSLTALAVQAAPVAVDYGMGEEKLLFQKVFDAEIVQAEGTCRLSSLYSGGPLAVAWIYTRCFGICTPLMVDLAGAAKWLPGELPYKILVLSFDPRDCVDDMRALARRYGLENDPHWIFATSPQMDSLNRSVGFSPRWDSSRNGFDHEGLVGGINDDGYLCRRLSVTGDPRALERLFAETRRHFNPSHPLPGGQSMLSCFSYDPLTGTKKPAAGLLILLLAPFATLLLLLGLSVAGRRTPAV
jgi:cytochrome oxidase Cu insertion factor (SCO1/SenC/PrrC family)